MLKNIITLLLLTVALYSCTTNTNKPTPKAKTIGQGQLNQFKYLADTFADIKVLRYQVPGFDSLSLNQKKLAYYLTEAALCGRDIIYDQNYHHNLRIRRTLEAIVSANGSQISQKQYQHLLTFAKRFWFSNGLHHHYSTRKLIPNCAPEYFNELVSQLPPKSLPLLPNETPQQLADTLTKIIFDPTIAPKKVNKTPLDANGQPQDLLQTSATNFYGPNVTQTQAETFYNSQTNPDTERPLSHGLNSQLVVGPDGELVEKTWKIGGMYGPALEKMVAWLTKAQQVAPAPTAKWLGLLIKYYQTGNLSTFDQMSIAWVNDTASAIDAINGFIEVYGDPLGYKGSFESVVSVKDFEASKQMAALAQNAAWFEQNSPIMEQHKKENVTGVSYKVITVINEAGDAAPATPIGINLPNARWIRQQHGSKSVSLGNIKDAYNAAGGKGTVQAFYMGEEVQARIEKYSIDASRLHTALHEVIGHGSGQTEPGVASPKKSLRNYGSTIEEARADLVSLYYLTDPKLVTLGLAESPDVGKAQYDMYITNGLLRQLYRIEPGEDIEEDHMRNRALVAHWVYQKGKDNKVIEKKTVDTYTYFVINDYSALRTLFGQLLREIQRIVSQGDFETAKQLVETYGVSVDQELLKEVKQRYKNLNAKPYAGFIQPILQPITENGKIVDIKIKYPNDFKNQMLYYGQNYSYLPHYN